MADFLLNYSHDNFVLIILAMLLLMILVMNPRVSNIDFRPMYITIYSILVFSVLDMLETIVTDDPSYYNLRMALSILCYWLRPIFSLGLIYVIVKETKKRFLIAIPELINILIMGAAALPVIGRSVFCFDENFCFQRGPLGYTVFVVGFFYVLLLLYLVCFRLRERNARETLLIVACALSIVTSSIVEAAGFIRHVTPMLVEIGCLVYYIMIYIQLTSVDALTGLYNREKFYADSKVKHYTAIASIDMNGLKKINDSQGHEHGDAALAQVGRVIEKNMNAGCRGYRIGGDEFLVAFEKMKEADVVSVCDHIRKDVEAEGLSAAIGYACSGGETLKELIRVSDSRMYADKEAFHRGRDDGSAGK